METVTAGNRDRDPDDKKVAQSCEKIREKGITLWLLINKQCNTSLILVLR